MKIQKNDFLSNGYGTFLLSNLAKKLVLSNSFIQVQLQFMDQI